MLLIAWRPRSTQAQHGQSLTEFAIILPVLILLFGALVDVSRVFDTMVRLESATRDAAELSSMNATSSTEATTLARTIVCAQFGQPATCSNPSVTTSWVSSTNSGGGNQQNPAVTVTVTSTTPFNTLLPNPFMIGADNSTATFNLSATTTYRVLQGK